MQTFYFKNTNTDKLATSTQKDDPAYPPVEWEEIDVDEYTDLMAEGTAPNVSVILRNGVQHNANSIKSNRRIGSFGFVIAAVALIVALFGLLQPKYDDKALLEKIAAVETKADANTTAITDANKAIADSASAANDAIAKLRKDASDQFTANRSAHAKLEEGLDATNTATAKLTKALEGKVGWASLKKVSDEAAADRAAIRKDVGNAQTTADLASLKAGSALAETAKNSSRLTAAEKNLAANRAAIIEVADRAATFANSAKVTRSWFLGKPRLESEKGVFDAPIFTEL
ncbi:hypothetical protein K9N08_04350 [Candidatus Gracilibacteria bacterium]|nr:hypothetical protein [Candidatus Gracilibacteria bacterium]MCF7856744.1 hypothetical protein [Candidatus Gracilibacteria bacterium]MCF7897050.1 hypothetical protein [Candidatus Gracilibacteria bacterium]